MAAKTLQEIKIQGTIWHRLYKEQESHARGGNPTQNTSRIGTTREKQEEETDAQTN